CPTQVVAAGPVLITLPCVTPAAASPSAKCIQIKIINLTSLVGRISGLRTILLDDHVHLCAILSASTYKKSLIYIPSR
ncbi:hypothetical protein HAX54_035366, partial [Datura stramonium]|nr:hypothetical protein [Datura stramonium]